MQDFTTKTGFALASAFGILGLGAPALAQDVSTEIALYGFGVAIGGETQIGDTVMDIDLSSRDVLNSLDAAFLGYIEHARGPWRFQYRAEFMDLGFDSTFRRGPVLVDGEAGFAQWTHSAYVGYRVQERPQGSGALAIDLLGGLRYVNIDMSVDANLAVIGPGVDLGFGQTVDFLDPVAAARATYAFNDAWSVFGWADIGGFTIGSEYSTSVELGVKRQFENGWQIFGGWKFFTFKYTDTNRFGKLTMTPTYTGPVFGGAYRF
ncbi:MAG: hypothetical protein OIF40_05635 [Mangrovicoccus sp.]|nr:hypothetical protein [Mangrovicoccus sp.]